MTQTDGTAAATPARRRTRWNATDLGLIAVFAALVAGSALIAAIPVGGLGVPITLQTLAVMLTGLALGPGRAFAAVGLYVLLGLAGLPIFSGGRSGLGVLAGPSAGYIIGFVFAATAVGWLTVVVLRRTAGRPGRFRAVLLFAAAMVSSIVFIHGLGILGMMVNAKLDFSKAFLADLVFYPGDVIKNVLAVTIALALHKAFPDLLIRRIRTAGTPPPAAPARSRRRGGQPAVSTIVLDRVAVRVAVDGRPAPKTLLEELSLRLTEQRIGVIGANGSGKSTLLRLLNGLVAPSSGTVTVDGSDTVRAVREVRRRVGFVFTDPLSQLVMPTGREDVELSLRRSVRNGRERSRQAEATLDRFGLLPLADQSIYELSGGERQLLALAAVLAVDPEVLVLDEPSTLLDLRNRELLRRTLAGLSQQVILSTHDLELALDLDRVLVVDAGTVVFDGGPAAAVAHYRELCAAVPPAPGAGLEKPRLGQL